ncbi:MAG: GntR family transcriptional regulator [Chloroflexia bacterium]|nr:GntR family transcriptional regulator [Chloroflexia bacterium]
MSAVATEPPWLDLGRDGSTPLHQQIAAELRRQIAEGELRPGDPLPSEHTLMRRFGVSRGTIRQARAALRSDGTITGSRGRPLAVRGPQLTQPLSELISFSSWIQSLGKRPSGRIIEFGPQPADETQAAMLGVGPGATIYFLLRVRLADDEPLLIERTVFPPRVGQLVAALDLERQSIYAELGRQGVVFASARHVLGAMPATRIDAQLLDVPVGTPLLRERRHTTSASGEPLEWSDDRYLAARINFTFANTATATGVVRQLDVSGGD